MNKHCKFYMSDMVERDLMMKSEQYSGNLWSMHVIVNNREDEKTADG